jgi:hypothetical protein
VHSRTTFLVCGAARRYAGISLTDLALSAVVVCGALDGNALIEATHLAVTALRIGGALWFCLATTVGATLAGGAVRILSALLALFVDAIFALGLALGVIFAIGVLNLGATARDDANEQAGQGC